MSAHLAVIDMQNVFADPASEWFTRRFDKVIDPIDRLVSALGPRTTFTRFVAPHRPSGPWRDYYERWPFALAPPDSSLYALVDHFASQSGRTLDATTFGKWGAELAARLDGADTLVIGGVSTECCVLSTAVAAADAGVRVLVAADACAGADDASHANALAVLEFYAPLVQISTTEQILASTSQR